MRITPDKGAKFVLHKPNRKAPDGFEVLAYSTTEEGAWAQCQMLKQNKGRRHVEGATVVPIQKEK